MYVSVLRISVGWKCFSRTAELLDGAQFFLGMAFGHLSRKSELHACSRMYVFLLASEPRFAVHTHLSFSYLPKTGSQFMHTFSPAVLNSVAPGKETEREKIMQKIWNENEVRRDLRKNSLMSGNYSIIEKTRTWGLCGMRLGLKKEGLNGVQ